MILEVHLVLDQIAVAIVHLVAEVDIVWKVEELSHPIETIVDNVGHHLIGIVELLWHRATTTRNIEKLLLDVRQEIVIVTEIVNASVIETVSVSVNANVNAIEIVNVNGRKKDVDRHVHRQQYSNPHREL